MTVKMPLLSQNHDLCDTNILKGKVRSQADMLIAATASVHRLRLITRNERDFEDCNIIVINPFV